MIDDESVGIEDTILLVIVAESVATDVVPTTMELKLERIDDIKLPVLVIVEEALLTAVETLVISELTFLTEVLDKDVGAAVTEAPSAIEDGFEAMVDELPEAPDEASITADEPVAIDEAL